MHHSSIVRRGCGLLTVLLAGRGQAQQLDAGTAHGAVLSAMHAELSRSLQTFRAQPQPPYFISYDVTDTRSAGVHGAFGTITDGRDSRRRVLGVDVRVGTAQFDNTHEVAGGMPSFGFFERYALATLPVGDDPAVIRRIIWYQTDLLYKRAVERLARIKASAQLRVTPEDTSPDFSREPPVKHSEPVVEVRFDRPAWEQRIRRYTAPFARYNDIYDGEASLSVEGTTRWYVNSDGSELQTSSAYYRLTISAYTRAADGMVLPRYESFVASSPEGLPSDTVVLTAVAKMIDDMHALQKAPVITAATAPAILSGRASGVFFHEVFGHRVEGHRQKSEEEAQTFKGKVGERLLPRDLSVYFDPTQRRLGDTELAGYYLYDDEGVAARRVDVVRNGVFSGFLMSRSPIAGFAHSNGHGRRQPGMAAVARQSNLVVTSSKPVTHQRLKQMLIAEVKRQQKPWGLIFDDIEGGFTLTTRFTPNAFEVMPVMVYRVFPNGREELVRGVDLVGTPLIAFSRIIAADDQLRVFNGVCGAESGWVPVSASSPSILISQIEIQRKEKAQEKPPILPPPGAVP
ncbi:MAG TPA: metallopeptidase TldD-related protein [Gemmatimonadaceae bacterium]|nr:metallopeptidase TldD-related protein [Gemmatimonadaceae bacterium]